MFFLRKNNFFSRFLASSLLLFLLLTFSAIHPVFASGCVQGNRCASAHAHSPNIIHTNGLVTISPLTLNGLDHRMTIQMPVDVLDGQDNTGNNWHVQVGMTRLANNGLFLPSSWSVALTGTCDNDSFNQLFDCNMPPDGSVFLLPGQSISLSPLVSSITASGNTPSLTTVISVDPNAFGDVTILTTLSATLLAKNTYAGTYSGLFKVAVVDGP